jgi:CID domain
MSAKDAYDCILNAVASDDGKNLTLFYLFNEIVQTAARKQITDFLEIGAAHFMPIFTDTVILPLPIEKRKDFIRVIEIWKDRKNVYSEKYCNQIIDLWKTNPQSVHPLIQRLLSKIKDKRNTQHLQIHQFMKFEQIPDFLKQLKTKEDEIKQKISLVTNTILLISSQ